MRLWTALALLVNVTLAPCAIAQSIGRPGAPESNREVWAETPSLADFAQVFPVQALRYNVPGRVVLNCDVDGNGRLARCAIAEETPAGMGFGRAALSVSSLFRMAPAARDQLSSDRIRLPISFEIQQVTPE